MTPAGGSTVPVLLSTFVVCVAEGDSRPVAVNVMEPPGGQEVDQQVDGSLATGRLAVRPLVGAAPRRTASPGRRRRSR